MQKVSRRNFVIGASAGAVAVGAAGVVWGNLQSPSHQKAQQFASTLATPLTVYVRDAAKGELVLLANNNQVIIHDVDLAARLLNAAQ
ncbi:MAG TPA: twin-arginine translocation signal domain-containing protein [Ktedonobacterales bacterium]|nr:twin-arginine translocation signal domain-containing protein [Ktedonobacterales bacterium]